MSSIFITIDKFKESHRVQKIKFATLIVIIPTCEGLNQMLSWWLRICKNIICWNL